MNLYVWKRKNTAIRQMNFYPLSLTEKIGENGFIGIALHAFFKKKEAIKYIEEIYKDKETRDYFELITIKL